MAIPVEDALARYPGAQTLRFGDTAELTAELLALVRAGRKRATCSAQAEIEAGAAAPVVGRRDISLDAEGRAVLVIETVRLVPLRFDEMTWDLAALEGENTDLEGWRADHERYYRRLGIFAPDMPLIWEEFRVAEDFAGGDACSEKS